MHILFVRLFNLFVFHLQLDVVTPLLLNASLLLVLTTDYSDWLVQVTESELIDNDRIFWVFTIVWLNNIELIDFILFDKWNQVLKITEMNDCCLFVTFSFLTALFFKIVINSLTH